MNAFLVLKILFYTIAICVFKSETVLVQEQLPISGRVIGGKEAKKNEAPFIVSIQYNGVHYCGGSILNVNWVVTAAHCLDSKSKVLVSTLIAGSNNVKGTGSTTQTRKISSYVVHDLYIGGTAPYDIGLVYTSTAFTLSSAVGVVKLPKSGSTPTGNANLYGWGSISTSSIEKYPTELQVATLPIISLTSCENALGPKGADVHNTNICTGPLTGGVGFCSADSGGPLVQGTSLVGIVSWGKLPCGQVNSPSVYVKVSDFIPWIQQNQVVPKPLKNH